MDMITERLEPTVEDSERINLLLGELNRVIARSNNTGLEIDFDHWARVCFAPVTGYGESNEDEVLVPAVFRENC